MVTRTRIEIVDDLTGEPGAQTFAFSLGSTGYEIDLVELKPLTDALAPFIKVARRPSRRGHRPPVLRPAPVRDNAAVRAWAREQGQLEISSRGRVPFAVLSEYDAAHGDGDAAASRRAGGSLAGGKVVIPVKPQRQGANPKRQRAPRQ